MNFSGYQWLSSIALDLLLKCGFVFVAGIFTLVGAGPFETFINIAISLTVFHYICLSLALGLASLFSPAPAYHCALALFFANVVFIGILHLLFSPDESSIVWGGFWIALILVTMNLLPILPSAAS